MIILLHIFREHFRYLTIREPFFTISYIFIWYYNVDTSWEGGFSIDSIAGRHKKSIQNGTSKMSAKSASPLFTLKIPYNIFSE